MEKVKPWLGEPQNTIAVLQKYGFVFQKKYGQNFLIDPHVLDKIVAAAGIGPDDFVVEIGPGIGTLTQYLAYAARSVCAVEIDKNLIPILEDTLSDYDNVEVINNDVLKEDLAALDKYSDEKERLEAGMKLLMSDENVKKLSGSTATYAELCDAAEEYFASQIDSANDEAWWANVLTAALTVTVVLALISLLLWQFVRSSGAAAIIAGVSAVAALVCGVLWHNHCPADGTLAFAAGLTLCLIAVVCTDLMAHRAKEAPAVPASSATAN